MLQVPWHCPTISPLTLRLGRKAPFMRLRKMPRWICPVNLYHNIYFMIFTPLIVAVASAPVASSAGTTESAAGSEGGESRKRGRPRKYALPSADGCHSRVSSASESSGSSRRGRPRKKPFLVGRPRKDSAGNELTFKFSIIMY
jgi:AT hook motif